MYTIFPVYRRGLLTWTYVAKDHGMTTTYEQMTTVEPRLRVAPNGWLALSPDGFHPGIGVFGATEEDARLRFQDELAAWADLHNRPSPAPTRPTGMGA